MGTTGSSDLKLAICYRHPQGATLAKPGTSFYCPLCQKPWTYGEGHQRPIRYRNDGIV